MTLKHSNGSLDSSSDDEEIENDELLEYTNAKISYPRGESLLRWWSNHSLIYKKLSYFINTSTFVIRTEKFYYNNIT